MDIAKSIEMTYTRSESLLQLHKSQFKGDGEYDEKAEEKVKILIYNLCREIKQIFLIFGSFLKSDKS